MIPGPHKRVMRIAALLLAPIAFVAATPAAPPSLSTIVARAVRPVMARYRVPGMAVGIVVDGVPHVFTYGLADVARKRPVTHRTLFELGSVSKTLTATLVSREVLAGRLSLDAPVARYLPDLRGTAFGRLTLLELGTHTTGGLPLQVPDDVHDTRGLFGYLARWRPRYAPGTYRTYSNIGIGVLGLIAARRAGSSNSGYGALMQREIFAPLGMHRTFIDLPPSAMAFYAEGYRHGKPIRMHPGVLDHEAYGVRTTASDMLRFLSANMNELAVAPALRAAIEATHTGYFRDGAMTQDLIWEQLPDPVSHNVLASANGVAMLFDPTPVRALRPPMAPQQRVWLNKTESTNGFGAYVAVLPSERIGIVLLANESYPIAARVELAERIVDALHAAR